MVDHVYTFLYLASRHTVLPAGIKGLLTTFPELKLLTSEVYSHCENHFGKIYFGTD